MVSNPYRQTYRLSPVPLRKYKVIQWYTGQLGREQIRLIQRHPNLELVGAVCWHKEKDGRDAGEIAGIGPIGVKTVHDAAEALAIDADIVLLNPYSDSPELMEKILRSGKNLINIMGAWDVRTKPYYAALQQAALDGGVSVHGAGNMPGMLNDVLPSLLSGYASGIEMIDCRERSYHGNHTGGDGLKLIGYARKPEDLGPDTDYGRYVAEMYRDAAHQGNYTVAMALSKLGPDSRFETRITTEFAPAPRDLYIESAKLEIPKGTVAGLRYVSTSYINDKPWHRVEMEHVAVFDLGPQWRSDPEELEFRIGIKGRPDLEFRFGTVEKPGDDLMGLIQLNAARLVNLIPAVVEARPGCITYMDLPIVTSML